ncbi:fungal-specific transcription factor domain-containing protein [Filobasidium floriforme]|uniref:fungal-specific transcription factor domain-containing protein n=1 Tax=Filobasidium floriforme TaxID=5210 RepID=UPI001E8EC18E|nr:fungal-specific transcription factor domain-containing protein [Filobasidium floriforme]KAH8080231.1 fungal-specific transcription factor domain-containing protein [Filobasidium floriforme]
MSTAGDDVSGRDSDSVQEPAAIGQAGRSSETITTASSPIAPRRRKFSRKSKDGCLPCKSRRVKCGEEKPSCKTCVLRRGRCTYPESEANSPSLHSPNVQDIESRTQSRFAIALAESLRSLNRSVGTTPGDPFAGFAFGNSSSSSRSARSGSSSTGRDHNGRGPTGRVIRDGITFNHQPRLILDVGPSNHSIRGPNLFEDDSPNGSVRNFWPYPDTLWPPPAPSLPFLDAADALKPFFPRDMDRLLFHHFTDNLCQEMTAVRVDTCQNPWLTQFAILATLLPHGFSPAHDAFRSSLLALASSDRNYKTSRPGSEYRQIALDLLYMTVSIGEAGPGTIEGDMIIASSLALTLRDKFAGDQRWEEGLLIGTSVILSAGGPLRFMAARPTPQRRFLIEQLVCLEVWAFSCVLRRPLLCDDLGEWFLDGAEYGLQDQVEIVHGIDRATMLLGCQAGHLWFEHVRLRQLEATACAYPQVKAAIANQDLVWRGDLFNFSCKTAANTNKCQAADASNPMAFRVSIGNRAFTLSMDIWISQMLQEHPSEEWVKQVCAETVEMLDLAIDQGHSQGLLFAVRAAAEVAVDPDLRRKVSGLYDRVAQSYRCETAIAQKTTTRMWKILDEGTVDRVGTDFAEFLRMQECYVPVF